MTMPTPVPGRGTDRRTAILDAAAVEFDRQGFGAASIAGIAKAAGVSQGAIHFHFRTKQAIALGVIDEQNARTFAAVTFADPSPLGGLVVASRTIAGLLLEDPVVRAGIRLSLENRVFSGATSAFYDQWIASVVDVFRLAVAAGEVDSTVSAEALGATVVPWFTGVQLVSDVRAARADLLPAVGTMWRVLTHACVAPAHRVRLLAVVDRAFACPPA
ncbi:ScbR family autoregulator-binding transcription factor [Curtobacterium sp. MCSS17_015]|uniref:ScbR family autoregulator-binding transcription factor n=1 Tax=Curtobacterium sp. MCSS17_015 TaxID=2175666 RepID=UPI000DAA566E|nr:ScbR family autoregulator-binding transcription factor [Curtobacterium sp. MCSS17_015]WIB25792.1 ScbR family autoregulator-binding transcription factor [Curtobacterium sp. MCSS17_015]